MPGDNINGSNIELGTFRFLGTGWWIFHIIVIVGVFYLGWLYGGALFR